MDHPDTTSLLQGVHDPRGDLGRLTHSGNPAQRPPLLIIAQQGGRLLKVNPETLANDRLDVIIALNKLAAALVALALDFGRLELDVIARAARLAGAAAGETLDELHLIHID